MKDLIKQLTEAYGPPGYEHAVRDIIDNWLMHDGLDSSQRKLYLDFGVKNKKDVPVRVGDVAGFERPFVDLGDTLVAKSMDDRIGCAILIETLQQLQQTPHEVHFVFTVQEEVGTRGATTAAYKVHPDVSIAIDVTDSGDIPERKNFEVKMGDGPAIKVMDRGMLAHPGVKRWMVETAVKNKIPYQMEILTLGTTDARAMQLAREGSAAGALSVPCRHIHTPSEMLSYSDVQNAVKLLLAMLSGPALLEDRGQKIEDSG
ncbi:MAG: M20/M25/M40 family metallo-hydrolase [Chloroflexi bacterium]|nr:M20/M25/M40 family metallo-hydrolase [Chloroflexota bacterium]